MFLNTKTMLFRGGLMKLMNYSWLFFLFVVLAGFALSLYVYSSLPDSVPIHWNADGEIDGYGGKDIALFMMPVISLFLTILFVAIPKIDPLKKNYAAFRGQFDIFILVLLLFFLYIHLLTVMAGFGYSINMSKLMLPAMGLLFLDIAFLLRKSKRNWFVGIRTPWTLSSDVVWDKTHRVGSYGFVLLGLIIISLAFLPSEFFLPLLIGAVAVLVTGLFGYSYFVWKQEEKKSKKK